MNVKRTTKWVGVVAYAAALGTLVSPGALLAAALGAPQAGDDLALPVAPAVTHVRQSAQARAAWSERPTLLLRHWQSSASAHESQPR